MEIYNNNTHPLYLPLSTVLWSSSTVHHTRPCTPRGAWGLLPVPRPSPSTDLSHRLPMCPRPRLPWHRPHWLWWIASSELFHILCFFTSWFRGVIVTHIPAQCHVYVCVWVRAYYHNLFLRAIRRTKHWIFPLYIAVFHDSRAVTWTQWRGMWVFVVIQAWLSLLVPPALPLKSASPENSVPHRATSTLTAQEYSMWDVFWWVKVCCMHLNYVIFSYVTVSFILSLSYSSLSVYLSNQSSLHLTLKLSTRSCQTNVSSYLIVRRS